MSVLKKIIGVFILFLAVIFSIGTLLNIIRQIKKILKIEGEFTSYDIGYTIGIFIGLTIISILTFYMGKFGLKLIRNKKEEIESVDEIGKL